MANVFKIVLAGSTLKLPDGRGTTYRVGPFKYSGQWYVFLLDTDDHRVKCIRIGTTSGGAEIDAVATTLKPRIPDNEHPANAGEFGWEQWEAVIDDDDPGAPDVYIAHLDGFAGPPPRPFQVSRFNFASLRWQFGSTSLAPEGVTNMGVEGVAEIGVRTFHAAGMLPTAAINAFQINILFTGENADGRTRPRFVTWRNDTDAWGPTLTPTFLPEREATEADVAQILRLKLASANQGYYRRDQSDISRLAGELWNQNLIRTTLLFFGSPIRVMDQDFAASRGPLIVGVPSSPFSTSDPVVVPFVDTSVGGTLLATITPAGISTPQATPEVINIASGTIWRFPVAVKTVLGEDPEVIRVYVIDLDVTQSKVWRFKRTAGVWDTGKILHVFENSVDGVPIQAATGGGSAADGSWYLLEMEGPTEGERNVWAVFDGGNVAKNYTGPAPGVFP